MGDRSSYPGISQIEKEELTIRSWLQWTGIKGEFEDDSELGLRIDRAPDAIIKTSHGNLEIEVTSHDRSQQELINYIADAILKKEEKYGKRGVNFSNYVLLIDASPVGSLVDLEDVRKGIISFPHRFRDVWTMVNMRKNNFDDYPFNPLNESYQWIKILSL